MLLETSKHLEAVAVHPGDVVQHAVHGCVVLRAGEGCGILFDGDDALPFLGEGEGDGVAACAGEDVDDGVFAGGRVDVGGDVFGDFSRISVSR